MAVLLLVPIAFAELSTVDSNDLTVDVSYKNLENHDNQVKLSKSLRLKETETKTYTFSVENVKNDYSLTLDSTELEIGTSEVSLSYTLKTPVDVDAGTTGTIATIKAVDKADTNNVKTFELKTDVENMLDVKKIRVYINNERDTTINQDDENVKNLKPGDNIELRFQLRNLFDNNYDEGDLDVTATVTIDDSDFGNDIDEEEEITIDASKEVTDEDFVIKFTIPQDAQDGDYEANMKISGKDGNKAKFETRWQITFGVQREADDLRIPTFNVLPTTISCNREIALAAKVVNSGSDRQRGGALTFTNAKLSLDQEFKFDIRDRDTITKEHIFEIGSDVAAGTYSVLATTYYDNTIISHKETANVIVKECVTQKVTPPPPKTQVGEDNTDTTTDKLEVDKVSSADIAKTVETKPYDLQDVFLGFIIFAIIVIMAVIVLSLTLLLKK